MKTPKRAGVNRIYLTPMTGAYLWYCGHCGAQPGRPCIQTRKDSDGVRYIVGKLKKPHPVRFQDQLREGSIDHLDRPRDSDPRN